MGTPALRLTGVAVALGDPPVEVLSGVDLDVVDGEVLAVVGRSGVGKSTLLAVMAGLIAPSAGEVASDISGRRARTATVFQDASLYPWLDVLDNVAFSLRLANHPGRLGSRKARRAKALEILESLDISEFATRRPSELSGGQQQRVAIARAIAADPDVLLMDEPFSALDVATRSSLQEWLVEHRTALARSVVLVTHDLAEALFVGDRIALLAGASGEVNVWTSDVQERHEAFASTVRTEIEGRIASS